jgi:hypothetical protein
MKIQAIALSDKPLNFLTALFIYVLDRRAGLIPPFILI